MASFMPFNYTQIPLLALGGLLILIGAAIGPETKDVDITAPQRETDRAPVSGEAAGSTSAHRRMVAN